MRPSRSALLCIPMLVLAMSHAPAVAAGGTSYTWVGSSNSSGGDNHSWGDQHNWSPVGVPGTDDSVLVEQPSPDDCAAHVDGVPTVTLTDFTLLQNPGLCTTSITGGAITVTGTLEWNGGALDTPTTVTGTGTVSGTNAQQSTLVATLDVAGSLALSGLTGAGAWTIDAGTQVTIEPGAALTSTGTNVVGGSACCTTPARIHNLGTVEVDGGSLTMSALRFDQWATLATTSHGTLDSTGGPVTTDAAGTYTGNGTWTMHDRAAATFAGTQQLGHAFVLDFGGLGSTFSSTLGGAATLTGTGTFSWTGGVIEAALTIAHGVRMRVDGAHTGGAGRVLEGQDTSGGGSGVPVTQTNHGTIALSGHATVTTAGSAHLVNASDGVVALSPGTAMSAQGCCVSPDRLVNSGTVTVPASAGAAVSLTGLAYRSSGTTSIAAGHTLVLAGGAPDALTGGHLTGGGTLSVTTPTAVSGTVSVTGHTTVQLGTHGSLDGTATLAGAGAFRWTGGALSGRPTVATAGGIAVSGGDIKTVANIGGGSTPSSVRFTVPTTIAAGTSHVHDTVVLGSSRLVLAAPTTIGRFTEIDDGVLENDSTLSIHAATVPIRGFTQKAHGVLSLDAGHAAHGALRSIGAVALAGAVRVHNTTVPPAGSSFVVVTAQTLQGGPSCVTTSGSGASSGHWTASQTATQLVLHWRRGTHTHC